MSGETLEENEAAERALSEKGNADSATSNQEEPLSDAQLGNKVEIAVDVENERDKETNGNAKGGENALTFENTISDVNGDHMVKLYQDSSEDEDDEEDDLWEDHDDDDDSEEEDEETAIDEDEASEEEETEGEDNEEDFEEDEQIVTNKDEVSKKDAIEEENKKENAKVEKEIANGDEGEAVQHNVQKVEVNLKANKSKGKRENNKAREESLKKLVTIEKPKSSIVKKGKKRVENMGMIFMCSSNTKNDCFKYMVLGQSESRKNVLENIYPVMRLFLYDIDLKLMYGIFKARERGGYNIEPKAFKSKFPSQVHFTVLADCLPLAEEKFKKVIKENYFTKKKFDCQLNSEQVKNLCKLFKSTSKGIQPKKLPRSRKAEESPIPIPIRGEGYRKRQAEDKRQPIPLRGEGSRKRRTDDKRCPERKEKIRYVELSRKRPRKAISPVARSRQILPPSSVPSIAPDRNLDVDPYRRDPYLESRDRDPYRHDPYESR